MNYLFYQPSSILSHFIRYYWVYENVKPNCIKPYRIVPQGCMELLFFFGDPYCSIDQNGEWNCLFSNSIITGQQSSFFDLKPIGTIGIFSILFKPHGVKMFFNIPIKECANRYVSLHEIANKGVKELEEKLFHAKNNCMRVRYVEQYLIEKLKTDALYEYNRFNSVMNLIRSKKGNLDIDELAYCGCYSYKQLYRKFLDFIGMSPKQYLKIIQFQHALSIKQYHPQICLTQLALECGYYDHAHFTNEFKKITGYTPKMFFSISTPYSDYFTN